jgi:hypothetical protein
MRLLVLCRVAGFRSGPTRADAETLHLCSEASSQDISEPAEVYGYATFFFLGSIVRHMKHATYQATFPPSEWLFPSSLTLVDSYEYVHQYVLGRRMPRNTRLFF